MGDPVEEIGEFIESELERHGNKFSGYGRPDIHERKPVRDALHEIFSDAVSGA